MYHISVNVYHISVNISSLLFTFQRNAINIFFFRYTFVYRTKCRQSRFPKKLFYFNIRKQLTIPTYFLLKKKK